MDANMHEASTMKGGEDVKPTLLQHHTLHLLFPACQLLPEGKRPFVERPTRIADREEPEFSSLGLCADDIEIYVRMQSDHGVSDSLALIASDLANMADLGQPINLTACIHRLTTFAGVSHLHVVS